MMKDEGGKGVLLLNGLTYRLMACHCRVACVSDNENCGISYQLKLQPPMEGNRIRAMIVRHPSIIIFFLKTKKI